MAYFTLLWPILHLCFKISRKYTGIGKYCKNMLSKFFQKIKKIYLGSSKEPRESQKVSGTSLEGFWTNSPKFCFLSNFLVLRVQPFTWRRAKKPILPCFLPILRCCSPKGCTQSTKKVHKNQNFLDFVQKSSKLFPDTFWTSQGTLEPPKCIFCDFWQNRVFASRLKIGVVSKSAENTRGRKKFNFDFCDFETFWGFWGVIWGRRTFFYPFRPKIWQK